jgi:hypothetical protein
MAMEAIMAHAGHIADVVTDIVGDDTRIAWVVLRDPGLDLAHQIGADVGTLGEDAAADTGEQGYGRRPHAEAVDNVGGGGIPTEEQIQHAEAEQTHGRDAHAHDRTAVESDREGRGGAVVAGRGGRTDVGAGGSVHADKAGGGRAQRADEEGDHGLPAQRRHPDEDRDDDCEDRQVGILPAHEDHRAAMDQGGDLGQLARAFGILQDLPVDSECGEQAKDTQDDGNQGFK